MAHSHIEDIETPGAAGLLCRLLVDQPPPFALLYRPDRHAGVELVLGEISEYEKLADLPVSGAENPRALLAIIPYRQVTERQFACRDDGEPIIGMNVTAQETMPLDGLVARLPDLPVTLRGGEFDLPDEDYEAIVGRVVRDEIGQGAGSNFVVKRTFTGDIDAYSVAAALSLFRKLLLVEQGSYWTFIVHTGKRTFVGATPEAHVRLQAGVVTMNPISGTYRYPVTGPTVAGLLGFLTDRKEADELYMVVDEELKMMARLCHSGGRVTGPGLKEMARLAHTEYLIEGRTSLGIPEILHRTMFAPTVTGSPLENACRVLARHEPTGRAYYSGAIALIGTDSDGMARMDSAILIRTADIGQDGRLLLSVGSTLVRESVPASEAEETRCKAAGLLAVFGTVGGQRSTGAGHPALSSEPRVDAALRGRNSTLSRFWLLGPGGSRPELAGRRALVVDAEDDFTAMLGHQLRALGLNVTIRHCLEPVDDLAYDLVVVGPGPGDPGDSDAPRIRALGRLCSRLLAGSTPFLAECLGHQVLASRLGLEVIRQKRPSQGLQTEIDLFGHRRRVGFYNTFSARSEADWLPAVGGRGPVELCRESATGRVHAIRGRGFASVQFHLESLLTEQSEQILGDLLTWCLNPGPRGRRDHNGCSFMTAPPSPDD